MQCLLEYFVDKFEKLPTVLCKRPEHLYAKWTGIKHGKSSRSGPPAAGHEYSASGGRSAITVNLRLPCPITPIWRGPRAPQADYSPPISIDSMQPFVL